MQALPSHHSASTNISTSASSSNGGVATVRLAPIIKTNTAQAMALDINMLSDTSDGANSTILQQSLLTKHKSGGAASPVFVPRPLASGGTGAASPQLGRKHSAGNREASASSSPLVGTRPALQHQSSSGSLIYTFRVSVPEERQSTIEEEQSANSTSTGNDLTVSTHTTIASAPALTPLPPLVSANTAASDPLLGSPSELHPTSSAASFGSADSIFDNNRMTSASAVENRAVLPQAEHRLATAPVLQQQQSSSTFTDIASSPSAASANEIGEVVNRHSQSALLAGNKSRPLAANTHSSKRLTHNPRVTNDRQSSYDCSDCWPMMIKKSSSSNNNDRRLAHRHRTGQRHQCCENLVTCNPCRLSFRFTLVLLCILQVVISAGIVWYLGYSTTLTLINDLSSQLRQTALVEITGEVHDQMVRPMAAVNQLTWSYSRYSPALDSLTSLTNTTGLYADLSMVALNYPAASGMGCATWSGLSFSAINISAYLGAGSSPANTQNVTSGYGYAIVDSDDPNVAYYHLPPASTSTPNPNLPLPDFNASSTVDQVRNAPLWYIVKPYVPNTRPQFLAAVMANGDFTWSSIYQLAASANMPNQTVIAATKAHINASGQVAFVCFATIFLNRLGDLLRSLAVAYGRNGIALILDQHGVLVASSDIAMANQGLLLGNPPIYLIDDDKLRAISKPLADNWLFNNPANITAPTGQFVYGGTFYQNNPAFPAVPITIDGGRYHLQATVLNNTGLLWTIVVVTKDTDFNGDFEYHQLVVGMLSMMVLVLAILVMLAITHCLNRPLSLVVKYMSAVAKMGKQRQVCSTSSNNPSEPPPLSRSAEQLKALKEIYERWQQAVTIHFDEGELEISRTSRPSRSSHDSLGSPRIESVDSTDGSSHVDSKAVQSHSPYKGQWFSKLIDKSAVCLMREVEDMQFTFHSMLHQLTKSTQEVENANEAKRHFVRYIFHEVRVPLNAVMLGLADLRAGCGSRGDDSTVAWTDDQRDVLDIVHEQSQVVGRILNDVLSLHKIEDGALTLQFASFSLESMILSTMQSFQPGIAEKSIHYTAQLQTVQSFVFPNVEMNELVSMPQIDVVGDKYRLRQVLANYLSNAIKFTHYAGSVHVSLQILSVTPRQRSKQLHGGGDIPFAQNATSNTNIVHSVNHSHSNDPTANLVWPPDVPTEALFRIAVRDTGVGVSVENQKKLFSPYMQVLPGELQKGGGSGLGLSIAQSLIRIHGGEIGYVTPDSQWGNGSEFYFEVPLQMVYRSVNNYTPQTSQRVINGDGKETLDDEDTNTGTEIFNDDRQEEDHFIKELATLQRESMGAQSRALHEHAVQINDCGSDGGVSSCADNTSDSPVNHLSTAAFHLMQPLQSSLYSSRPTPASPDSSMRVLAQQRLHLSTQLRSNSNHPSLNFANNISSSPTSLSQQASRRLVNLARVPSSRRGDQSGSETSGAESNDGSCSSKSVSLVLHDRVTHLAASPLAMRRSPLNPARRMDQRTLAPHHSDSLTLHCEAQADDASEHHSPEDDDVNRHSGSNSSSGSGSGSQPRSRHGTSTGQRTQRRPTLVDSSNSTPPRTCSTGGTPSSRSDIYITLNSNGSHTHTHSLGQPKLSNKSSSPVLTSGLLNGSFPAPSPLSSRAVVSTNAFQHTPTATGTSATEHSDSPVLWSQDIERANCESNLDTAAVAPATSTTPGSEAAQPSVQSPVAAVSHAPSPASAPVLPTPSFVPTLAPAASSSPLAPPPLRVLVAEDSVPNLKLLLVLLRKLKCVAEGVENGQLCVNRFAKWQQAKENYHEGDPLPHYPCDVVLIDGNMPVLSGPDATRQLRAMGVSIPIYAVTGNAMEEDVQHFLDAGVDAVLSKPIQQKELARLLSMELKKKINASTSMDSITISGTSR